MLVQHEWRAAPRGWQFLAASGVALSLGGVGFIVRFWEPLPGPYVANELYPLGPYVNTWAVSFGFMWLAFGLAFSVLAVRGKRDARTWWVLLGVWMLAWLPHAIIAVGFVGAGSNEPSVDFYRAWASRWPGLLVLWVSGLLLATHLGLSTVGFVLTGRALRRGMP